MQAGAGVGVVGGPPQGAGMMGHLGPGMGGPMGHGGASPVVHQRTDKPQMELDAINKKLDENVKKLTFGFLNILKAAQIPDKKAQNASEDLQIDVQSANLVRYTRSQHILRTSSCVTETHYTAIFLSLSHCLCSRVKGEYRRILIGDDCRHQTRRHPSRLRFAQPRGQNRRTALSTTTNTKQGSHRAAQTRGGRGVGRTRRLVLLIAV